MRNPRNEGEGKKKVQKSRNVIYGWRRIGWSQCELVQQQERTRSMLFNTRVVITSIKHLGCEIQFVLSNKYLR